MKKCVIPAKYSSTGQDRVIVLREVTRAMQRKVASKYTINPEKAGAQLALDMQDDMMCEAIVKIDDVEFKFPPGAGSVVLNKTFNTKELTLLNAAFEKINTIQSEDVDDFLSKMEDVEDTQPVALSVPRKLA